MDVSAFTLATAAMLPEEGVMAVPGTAVAGGDAFAKLMSGLGIAPMPAIADAAPVADVPLADAMPVVGETAPVDPAMLLTAHPVAPAMARTAKGDGTKPALPAANDEREPRQEAETPTPASLGLPPLLAALIAPTLAQAAPERPAATAAAGSPPEAATLSGGAPTPGLAMPTSTAPAPSSMPTEAPVQSSLPIPSIAAMPSRAAPTALASEVAPPAPAAAAPAALPGTATPPEGMTITPLAQVAVAAPAAPSPVAASKAAPAASLLAPAPDVTQPVAEAVSSDAAPIATRAVVGPQPAEDIADLPPPASPALPPMLRRATAAASARIDAAAPAKAAEEPASVLDIATPPSARPLPAAGPLPLPLDTAVASATPVSAPAETLAPAEQLIERQLDIAHEGEWLDQLTRDIVRTASAEGGLRFKLNPEHLGSLHVEVTQGREGASVRLTADTEQARTIIADARPQLIAEARAQGLRISEAHVDLNGQGQGHSQAGNGGRSGRDAPAQEYLTSWQPESAEEKATPSRRSTAERYA